MLIRADILNKTSKGWNVYEVKASTSAKTEYLHDAAIQWYVLSKTITLNEVFLVYVNNQYIRHGEINLGQLFKVENITKEVLNLQPEVIRTIDKLKKTVSGLIPSIDIGPHCFTPHECDFKDHCWSHVPDVSVFNLYRMRIDKKFALCQSGAIEFDSIPSETKLSAIQQTQVQTSLTGSSHIDAQALSRFLEEISYPICFFDFETFRSPIPRFDNQKPYLQMPFQYSLHIVLEDGTLKHHEFLGDHNTDPRRKLCEKLLQDLPSQGSIVAFNKSFEISRIREMAEVLSDLKEELLPLTERFIDLAVPFQKGNFYLPEFNGDFSLKSILPAMFPANADLSYKSLEIQDGSMAMDVFESLYLNDDEDMLHQIREDLLAYCKLDTFAMVKIWGKFRELSGVV